MRTKDSFNHPLLRKPVCGEHHFRASAEPQIHYLRCSLTERGPFTAVTSYKRETREECADTHGLHGFRGTPDAQIGKRQRLDLITRVL